MTYRIENLLFDLDGTLTDSKEGIVNSILYALEKLNITEEHMNELNSFIGPPLRNSFKSRYNLTDHLVDKALIFYRKYFSEKGIYENKVYQGVTEILQFFYSQKYRLFVATSKPTIFADKILRHFNIDKYFTGVIGSNLDHTRIDKTEIIAHLLYVYDLNPLKSIMIGDRKHDIIGAKNNLMKSIGVTYGYGSLEEISLQEPDYIIHRFHEIKTVLFN